MTSKLVSRHFAGAAPVTPRNNPWRAEERRSRRLGRRRSLNEAVEESRLLEWPRNASDVTLPLVDLLIHTLYECSRDPKSLRKQFTFSNLARLLKQTQTLLGGLDNVVLVVPPDAETAVTVVGDTHGQFHDILHIFKLNGPPGRHNWYVFNGDLIDRGPWGLEIVVMLFAYKVLYPDYVHIIRGNHETVYCTKVYGFYQECKHKYSKTMHQRFHQVFCLLPLAAVVLPRGSTPLDATRLGTGRGAYITHGGLFRMPHGSPGSIPELQNIDRTSKDPDSLTLLDVLWSDPSDVGGITDNYLRGCATYFGPDVTRNFLDQHGLHLMIRSHEGPDAREKRPQLVEDMMCGYAYDQQNEVTLETMLITLFSAPNYPHGPQARGNEAAFLRFRGEFNRSLDYEIVQFESSWKPDILPYPAESKDLTDHE